MANYGDVINFRIYNAEDENDSTEVTLTMDTPWKSHPLTQEQLDEINMQDDADYFVDTDFDDGHYMWMKLHNYKENVDRMHFVSKEYYMPSI